MTGVVFCFAMTNAVIKDTDVATKLIVSQRLGIKMRRGEIPIGAVAKPPFEMFSFILKNKYIGLFCVLTFKMKLS